MSISRLPARALFALVLVAAVLPCLTDTSAWGQPTPTVKVREYGDLGPHLEGEPRHLLHQGSDWRLLRIRRALYDSLPESAWRDLLVQRGATIVTEPDHGAIIVWLDLEDVSAIQELMVPEPFLEDHSAQPPPFLQVVEPLHPMYRLPSWVTFGVEWTRFQRGALWVRLAPDGQGNTATRDYLLDLYGEPRYEQEVQGMIEIQFDSLGNGRPTASELIDIVRREDVVYATDLAHAQGGPSLPNPDPDPQDPGGGGPANPNGPATIPVTTPTGLLLLGLLLAGAGWVALCRR